MLSIDGFFMKRILIVGCCGAGKTTIALQLGDILGIPVHHLDRLWWLPGWQEDSPANFDRKLSEILNEPQWIIDGNYKRTLSKRLEYADTVIWMRGSRWRCLWRILKRRLQYHKKSRNDIGPGCPERLDWDFLKYVWNYNTVTDPLMVNILNDPAFDSVKLIELNSSYAVQRFLNDCK